MTTSTVAAYLSSAAIPLICLSEAVDSWNKIVPQGTPQANKRELINALAWFALAGVSGYLAVENQGVILNEMVFGKVRSLSEIFSSLVSPLKETVSSAASYVKSFFVTPEPQEEVWQDNPLNLPTKFLVELQDLFCFVPHYLDKLTTGGQLVEGLRGRIQEPLKQIMRVQLGLNGYSNTLEIGTLALQTLVVKLALPQLNLSNLRSISRRVFISLQNNQSNLPETIAELAPHYFGEVGNLFFQAYKEKSSRLDQVIIQAAIQERRLSEATPQEEIDTLLEAIMPYVVLAKDFSTRAQRAPLPEEAYVLLDPQGKLCSLECESALRYTVLAYINSEKGKKENFRVMNLKAYINRVLSGQNTRLSESNYQTADQNIQFLISKMRDYNPGSTVDLSKKEEYIAAINQSASQRDRRQ